MTVNPEILQPGPKMEVDYKKCNTPMTCKKCLELCPQAVFAVDTIKYIKFTETDINEPDAYKIIPRHSDKCSGCMDCIKVCPQDAINIDFKGVNTA
ncbi:MAG: 4Fe-4S dicluster domain-containing protein [Dethiobacter sp.]|jgi:ferredoxin|nr:4Fe-4S dicluster domain-containing protein [Dethiobacter sp.]